QEFFLHRGLVLSRAPAFAPKGSLDGSTRCSTISTEGMAGFSLATDLAACLRRIGHFYFALQTRREKRESVKQAWSHEETRFVFRYTRSRTMRAAQTLDCEAPDANLFGSCVDGRIR